MRKCFPFYRWEYWARRDSGSCQVHTANDWQGWGLNSGSLDQPLPLSGMGPPGERDGLAFPSLPLWGILGLGCLRGALVPGGRRQVPSHLWGSPRLQQPCPLFPGLTSSTLLLLPQHPGQCSPSPAVNNRLEPPSPGAIAGLRLPQVASAQSPTIRDRRGPSI